MLTKEYKIDINASKQKVWFVLWDDHHYRRWTNVFAEGSYVKTDNWKEGSRVHFLMPEGKGMYSDVSENKLFEKMVFTHIGDINNFQEIPVNKETNRWTGRKETYTLTENNGITTLVASLEIDEDYLKFFEDTFPKALASVKELAENFYITVQTKVNAYIDKVWKNWTDPVHIVNWNNASDDWHTTAAENDLKAGGKFRSRMEAKDGSMGFDFEGIYTSIDPKKKIEYEMADARKVKIVFESSDDKTMITESFEAENTNPLDLQRDGWQSILNNFKKYTEL